MARIRTVKPAFFRHGGLYDAEQASGLPLRVAFIGLWTAADREGRFRWEPRELKLDCLPHDEVDFARVLDALVTGGFIARYEVGGREYGVIPSFTKHQIVNNRETASSLPDPPSDARNQAIPARAERVTDATTTRHDLAQAERKGTEGKGNEPITGHAPGGAVPPAAGKDYPPEFEALWLALPKRSGSNDKKAAFTAWKARRKEGHAVDAMQAGAVRYAAWCRATGKENTETVKQAATFLGPADPPHFTLAWLAPGQSAASAATEIASCDDSLRPWLPKLRQQFDIPTINSWFANCTVVERDDWFTLVVPTKWSAAYIEQNFGGRLRQVFGEQFQVGHGTPRAAA